MPARDVTRYTLLEKRRTRSASSQRCAICDFRSPSREPLPEGAAPGFNGERYHLLVGAVIGAQFGARVGVLLRGEQLRGLLALMVLAVCLKLGFDLVVTPDDVFSVELLK